MVQVKLYSQLTVFKRSVLQGLPISSKLVESAQFPDLKVESASEAAKLFLTAVSGGQWFLDDRFALVSGLPSTLGFNEYAVTVLDHVIPPGLRPEVDPSMFYVGQHAKTLLRSCPTEAFDSLFNFLIERCPIKATTKRYPFPVRVLTSSLDLSPCLPVVPNMLNVYRDYNLDIAYVNTDLPIVESHKKILDDCPDSPVLVVDADFTPNGNVDLMFEPAKYDYNAVHLWYVLNPVNGLVYGHGGPKLISTQSMSFSAMADDMTTSCANGLIVRPSLVGTHSFDTSPDAVYRTAAREIYKLLKKPSGDIDSADRLKVWLKPLAKYPLYSKIVDHVVNVCATNAPFPLNDYSLLQKEIDYALNKNQ